MNSNNTGTIVFGYLAIGCGYALLTGASSFLGFVGNMLFWLPHLLLHMIFGFLGTFIVGGIILLAVSAWIWPDFGKFIVYIWKKVWK